MEDFKNVEAVFEFAMLGQSMNMNMNNNMNINMGSSFDQESRTDFQMASPTIKRKLNDNPDANR